MAAGGGKPRWGVDIGCSAIDSEAGRGGRDLLVVEEALAILLWYPHSPAHGYALAANYCQHYDPRYGNGLNGPSRAKISAIAQFIVAVEASEARSK